VLLLLGSFAHQPSGRGPQTAHTDSQVQQVEQLTNLMNMMYLEFKL